MLQSLLKGIAWLIGVAAVAAFWAGGRAIHEITHAERILSEMEGIGLAAVLGLVAAVVNGAAERVDPPDKGEPVSLALGPASDKENRDL